MSMPVPRQKPRKDKPLPPLYVWGDCPSGQPPTVWEHSARPLWAQVVPERDVVLLIEKERLLGRRISSGALLWEQESTPMPDELAADARGIVVSSGAHLREHDPESGEVRWRQRPGGPIDRMALDADTAYLITNGPLFALDRGSGRARWKAPASPEADLHVFPSAGVVVVAETDEEILHAYRCDGGEPAWELTADEEPVVVGPLVGDLLCVSCHGSGAVGLDILSGDVRWELETERGFEAPGAALGERLFLTDGTLHALSAVDGSILWKRTLEDEDDSIFTVRTAGGMLFAETWSGRLLCLNPDDGSMRWEQRFGQVHGLTVDPSGVYLRGSREVSASDEETAAGWHALCVDADCGVLKWELRSPKLIPDISRVGPLTVLELRTQVLVMREPA